MSKLEEVSYEMLVFLHPRVSSRVAGFPVASPCLMEQLENMSFSNVSKQVVMSFCVAGMALCDIPTCLITCGKYQNWRKSRTKCSFFCTHVSRFESLVFPVASPCLWGKLQKSLLCQGFKFRMYWTVGSVRLAVCKDMARVGSCCRWKVVVWTHTYFTKCRLYIFLVLCRQTFRLCSIARERQAFTVHDRGGL